jgi:hypothetical protein
MKKVLFIVAVLALTTSCVNQDKKYRIETPDNYFYTDSYTVKDGCITFEEECDCTESGMQASTVCGSYTITTLK